MTEHRTIHLRPLLEDSAIHQWIDAQQDRTLAAACVRYALAFNTLDLDWLRGALSPFVTYESQGVFDKLSGVKSVCGHLSGKFNAIARSADGHPRLDLARMQGDVPCLAGFQPRGPLDTNWLRTPLINVSLTVDALSLIDSILIITVAPSPAAARCSGIFPGARLPRPPIRILPAGRKNQPGPANATNGHRHAESLCRR